MPSPDIPNATLTTVVGKDGSSLLEFRGKSTALGGILPKEVLSSVFTYLTDISPSLILRLSSSQYHQLIPDIYNSLEINSKTAKSILYGAIKAPTRSTRDSSPRRYCNIHLHEIDIDWNSRKVEALSYTKQIHFDDKDALIHFAERLSTQGEYDKGHAKVKPKRWRRLFPNVQYISLSSECVEAIFQARIICTHNKFGRTNKKNPDTGHIVGHEEKMLCNFEYLLIPHIKPKFVCLDHRSSTSPDQVYTEKEIRAGEMDIKINPSSGGTKIIHTYLGQGRIFKPIYGTLRIVYPSRSSISSRTRKSISTLPDLLEQESKSVVNNFKSSFSMFQAAEKLHKSIKIQYCIDNSVEFAQKVDQKMNAAIGSCLDYHGRPLTHCDEYFRNWKNYIEIVELDESNVCSVCGKY